MAESEIETLRVEVVGLLTSLRRRQQVTWDLLINDSNAANNKFVNQRQSLLEARVNALAVGSSPTLFEGLLGLFCTALPVGAFVTRLMSHWSRTLEIGKVSAVLGATKLSPDTSKQLVERSAKLNEISMRRERLPGMNVTPLRKPRIEFVREVTEHNANMKKFADTYSPEIQASIRAYIRKAADSTAKPVVSQDEIFNPKAVTPKSADVADSSDFLKAVQDWIVRSRAADANALEDMEKAADRTSDIEHLKSIKRFVEWDVFAESRLSEGFSRETFQKYIEMCLWCTTWDFRPVFVKAKRGNPIVGRGATSSHFEVPPLGDKFWNWACDRYCDPFTGDGTQTYSEIGRSRQLGNVPPSSVSAEVQQYTQAKGTIDPGFYPAERLAFHWGNVIAPTLLELNKDVANEMAKQLGIKKAVSQPRDADVFYQYLLGLKKVKG